MRTSQVPILVSLLLASCGGQALESSESASAPDAGADSVIGLDATAPPDSAAATDSAPVTPLAPEPGQNFLFELSRVNFAWAPTIQGAFITAKGEVYTYDYYGTAPSDAAVPPIELSPGMTEAQIAMKFGPSPALIATVDQATLLSYFALLGAARNGALLTQSNCADYGDDRYVGYLYDTGSATYTPVTLGSDGDLTVLNTAPEGEVLITWILSLLGNTGERHCRYRTTSCTGQLCPGMKPCTGGSVPQNPTDQGCLENCGPPSRCVQVNSCAVCAAANSPCVIDRNGAAHCVGWVPGCPEAAACSCGGESVCAGGAAYCQGNAATGLSCAPP